MNSGNNSGPPSGVTEFDGYLSPKSMITPGAAGSLVMLIGNSIVFAFPNVFSFHSVALLLSLLLSGTIHSSLNLKLKTRINYWILNSLIIFSMAVGTSNIGVNTIGARDDNREGELSRVPESLVISPVMADRFASEGGTVGVTEMTEKPRRSDRDQTQDRMIIGQRNSGNGSSKPRRRFFQRW